MQQGWLLMLVVHESSDKCAMQLIDTTASLSCAAEKLEMVRKLEMEKKWRSSLFHSLQYLTVFVSAYPHPPPCGPHSSSVGESYCTQGSIFRVRDFKFIRDPKKPFVTWSRNIIKLSQQD